MLVSGLRCFHGQTQSVKLRFHHSGIADDDSSPVIGITLPFFSYGGSSMMTMFAAMGLVSGVKYKPKPQLFSMMY